MTMFRCLLAFAAIVLIAAIYWAMGADDRGLGPVLAEMASKPWTIVTLIDLYLGFFLGAAVIWLFERSLWVKLLWAAPVFVLGNVWTAVWFAIRLPEINRRIRAVQG
ncbi:MAG: hypothetical protein AAGD92_00595 [Pseudomonadota bacterium]